MNERPFSYRALFAVVYTTSVSSVYFALGVVAHRADGLTPLVFLAAGFFFQLSAMTYAEGAALHPERGGSAVFARYAFNELVSFIAGWSIVLDYTILIAVAALTVPATSPRSGRRSATAPPRSWSPSGDRVRRLRQPHRRQRPPAAPADRDHRRRPGPPGRRDRARTGRSPSTRTISPRSIHLGTAPTLVRPRVCVPDRRDRVHRPRGRGEPGRRGHARASDRSAGSSIPGSAVIVLIYVGIAFVGISALPVHHGVSELGTEHIQAPVLGVVEAFRPCGSPTCSSTPSRSAARSAWSRQPAPRCSASPGSATRWPRTGRSPARSGGSAGGGEPRSS